jgi:uncharacterized damage-inducible protein DinB
MPRRRWFDRHFDLGLPAEAFPDILERLRGTPARLEERTRDLQRALLVRRVDGAWSAQENAGHLLDLEPLWRERLGDLLRGAAVLRAADLTNRRTHEAGHNTRPLTSLLAEFRNARLGLVGRLEAVSAAELARTALHPRLQKPMSVTDLFFFVAEHDDHHLARITEIARAEGDAGDFDSRGFQTAPVKPVRRMSRRARRVG